MTPDAGERARETTDIYGPRWANRSDTTTQTVCVKSRVGYTQWRLFGRPEQSWPQAEGARSRTADSRVATLLVELSALLDGFLG